jgi:NitT/TauT family transport system ATP-binding protein
VRLGANGLAKAAESVQPQPREAAPTIHLTAASVERRFPRSGGGELHALGPVELELRRGEFFSIIGPSGCGKSSLLDLLAGLAAPSAGSINFEGVAVKSGATPDGVGMVFQEDASFPWLSVADNVAFGLRRQGVPAGEVNARVAHALGLTGLADFAAAYPAQLSGGMRQRVCIARTLVTRPRLILLDEPFGALDAQTRLIMGEQLLQLWRETGATVLLVTHALDEAAMLSDRIGVMSARPGRILNVIATGWPRERDSTVAASKRFGDITAQLWSCLREESLKALSTPGGDAG